MARPNKIGLDYFPFGVDFFEDERVEAIAGEFGIKGEITVVKLLCAIYRNGYFILWNDLLKMKLLKNLSGVSSELLDQILNRLIKWGYFDESLFNSDKILTNVEIQESYFEASKRRKFRNELKYLLVNVDINRVNADINSSGSMFMYTLTTQTKGKVNKIPPNSPPFGIPVIIPIENFRDIVLNNDSRNEDCRRALKCDPEKLSDLITEFEIEQRSKGNGENTDKEYSRHFINWAKIRLENERKTEQPSRRLRKLT